MRIKFVKDGQRNFLKKVLINLNCPSLRSLKQFGLNVNYQTLKSYYNENRTLSLGLFEDLCFLAKIDKNSIKFKELVENWGQVKGGKSRRKNKFKRR